MMQAVGVEPRLHGGSTVDLGGAGLQRVLRDLVLRELDARGIADPYLLAGELGVLPGTTLGLLRRPVWPVETSLWLVAKLDLPIRVEVACES